MLGTTGATIIAIAYIVLAGAFGIAVGLVTCVIMRRRWGFKVIVMDATVAMLVALVVSYVVVEISVRRGIWDPALWPIWTVAALSVVPLHVLRRPSR